MRSGSPCEAHELVIVCRRLREWLETSEVPVSLHDSIVLGVHEAAVTAIEHAVPSEPIMIRGSIESGALTIDVTGAGGWADGAVADEVGSRRLLLIRELVQHVEIRPNPAGATVRLRQPI